MVSKPRRSIGPIQPPPNNPEPRGAPQCPATPPAPARAAQGKSEMAERDSGAGAGKRRGRLAPNGGVAAVIAVAATVIGFSSA